MASVCPSIYVPLNTPRIPRRVHPVNHQKREKLIQEVSGTKNLPLSVYFRVEESRKRKYKRPQVGSYYTIDKFVETNVPPNSAREAVAELPPIPTYSEKEPNQRPPWKKKVVFSGGSYNSNSFPTMPSVTPLSRSSPVKEKFDMVSAKTILKGSPPRSPIKRNTHENLSPRKSRNGSDCRVYWREDSNELYTISFRQYSSKGRYDPLSELHSDYYSIQKVGQKKRASVSSSISKSSNSPPTQRDFSALLVGKPVRIHPKYQKEIGEDTYRSDSMNDITRQRLEQQHLGYASAPLLRGSY